jgi:hypothetical protein
MRRPGRTVEGHCVGMTPTSTLCIKQLPKPYRLWGNVPFVGQTLLTVNRGSRMLRQLSLLACTILAACSTAQAVAPVHNPEADKQLNDAVAQRSKLRARWDGAKPDDQQFCETRAGDCRLQVSDQRDELISAHQVPVCRTQPDSDHEAICIADELAKLGTPEPATKYYKTDLWCLEKLTQCLTKHQEDLAENARLARITERRDHLTLSAQGVAWRSRVAAASEKIKYIRATLPPDADSECQQFSENAECDVSIKQRSAELDGELSKSDTEYDQKQAAKTYEQLTKVQASCYEPELKCLSKSVAKYGETNESRRWLQRNFDLLDKRQRLIEKAGDNAATPCLETSIASHQADIIQSYRAYVREPVLFFRTQLHRSFFAMHKSQIDCLGNSGGPEVKG